MTFRKFFLSLKQTFKNRILLILTVEILYLFFNYIFYLRNSPYYSSPVFVIVILVLLVLPFHILAREKNKTLTSNEKLMIRVIIDFLIKIQKVNEHEYENQSEILISLFKNHNSKKIAEFVHQPHNISMEDVYQKMSKKDVFFKTLLLKHLFRCSLYGKIVSIENEKIILETAQKLGINKAAFNKRKFFCEKAGYQFESRRKQGFHFVQNVSRLTEIEALRVLELETSASTAEIKNAKRRLSKLYHPDKACCKESSIDKFIEITEAYELLKTLRGFK